METPPAGYHVLNPETVLTYACSVPGHEKWLGPSATPSLLTAKEIGDGNLNLVFIVSRGDSHKVIIKQALPYVRCIGDSWPLPLKRAFFESEVLKEENETAPGLVPVLYHYDAVMSTIVMELLSPHIILRKGLIAGVKYPRLARDVGVFLGRTLFLSSDLALSSAAKKAKVAVFCGNTAMCDLSHDVIFTDPYAGSQHNHHTTPQLDDVASALLGDAEAKVAVSQLKARFMTDTQALLHGDLHTGSVMVTESQTRVIDPEFGFYGPMGFDIGAYVANLLLAYFAHHARGLADAAGYRKWLLGQIVETWEVFQETFEALWTGGSHKGDVYSPKFFAGDERAFAHARHAYMASILRDTAQFAGAKMIRRIVGVAHVEDLSGIADADARARCERAAVSLGRSLLVNPDRIARIQDIVVQAEKAAEGL